MDVKVVDVKAVAAKVAGATVIANHHASTHAKVLAVKTTAISAADAGADGVAVAEDVTVSAAADVAVSVD